MSTKVLLLFVITFLALSPARSAFPEPEYFSLPSEPLIRIGLSTNSSSVSITTGDASLVAVSPDEPSRMLGTAKVTVAARAYRPPEVVNYRIEFQNLATQADANDLAKEIREATGETALVSLDPTANMWRVWVGTVKETAEDAEELKATLSEKGFDDSVIVTEKKVMISEDAIALSQQLKSAGPSDVRSLTKATGSSTPLVAGAVAPNLREVIINGPSETAKYSSLKSVAFGSMNERANPVRLNGKAYRGKIEVFVNAKGSLTVVNVVPLEEYLLGVVPSELGLPQLEAQKAQAVAARTYAVANIGTFGKQGFDMVPTVSSQVYKGVSIETKMGTQAVQQTRGLVATYKGKPIMAYYTSTCGGRTESSENIFDHAEPYLVGVECSLEGGRHFEPFLIKTTRQPAKLRDEGNLELVQLMSQLAGNGFFLSTQNMDDAWFEDVPTTNELAGWINQLGRNVGKVFGNINRDSGKPAELATLLAGLLYPPDMADTLMSDSDINYQLAFDDAGEIPKAHRADVAMLLRDGYFTIHPDLTLKPNRPFSRAKLLRLIRQIYEKKKWMPALQSGSAKASVDGKLVLKVGKTERQLTVRPDVFLFRQFGEQMFPVREAALVGGEEVNFQTDATGAVSYLEVRPTLTPTTAENMSPFVLWNKTMSPGEVQSKLSRYVRGIGSLYDLKVKQRGYSRRAIELEIIGSNGTKYLKGGKIRSALRLNEQLFVLNKRYSGTTATSYSFTGRGWGHGVGMCQYGAFGLAKMGVKFDAIIKHYYTGVDLTKAY
ncbi:MAG: SpoIID/LytB domain-containing protein [Pyrinomonadaceae bacterium]|nr:SpoIID/LytB domain-containing protein [Pyrinomonadaceae bacterium]MBP6213018.1 SpoIID/LytB domain-containing protein [Pyrinomonadaceae bacterium]